MIIDMLISLLRTAMKQCFNLSFYIPYNSMYPQLATQDFIVVLVVVVVAVMAAAKHLVLCSKMYFIFSLLGCNKALDYLYFDMKF